MKTKEHSTQLEGGEYLRNHVFSIIYLKVIDITLVKSFSLWHQRILVNPLSEKPKYIDPDSICKSDKNGTESKGVITF